MVLDGLRGYLQLANGLTDVTRSRARSAAAALVAQGESHVVAVLPTPVRAQVASLTDDLVATSKANRDLLVGLVRAEVERSVSRLGLVSVQDLEVASRRARLLEGRVAELEADLTSARATASRASAQRSSPAATRSGATKKAATKKATTSKAATKSPLASTRVPSKTAASRTAASKTSATKKATPGTKQAARGTKSAASGKKSAAPRSRRSPAATT